MDSIITFLWLWGVAIVARWALSDAAAYWTKQRCEEEPKFLTFEEFEAMHKPWYVKLHWWLKQRGL